MANLKKTSTTHKTIKPSWATYQSPSQLEIPAEVLDYYADKGYRLKWVRVLMPNGDPDHKNIAKKMRFKFEAITHQELSNVCPGVGDMFELGENGKTKGFVMVGDLALFKRTEELSDQQTEWLENEAKNQVRGIKQMLQADGNEVINYKSSFLNKQVSFNQTAALDAE